MNYRILMIYIEAQKEKEHHYWDGMIRLHGGKGLPRYSNREKSNSGKPVADALRAMILREEKNGRT